MIYKFCPGCRVKLFDEHATIVVCKCRPKPKCPYCEGIHDPVCGCCERCVECNGPIYFDQRRKYIPGNHELTCSRYPRSKSDQLLREHVKCRCCGQYGCNCDTTNAFKPKPDGVAHTGPGKLYMKDIGGDILKKMAENSTGSPKDWIENCAGCGHPAPGHLPTCGAYRKPVVCLNCGSTDEQTQCPECNRPKPDRLAELRAKYTHPLKREPNAKQLGDQVIFDINELLDMVETKKADIKHVLEMRSENIADAFRWRHLMLDACAISEKHDKEIKRLKAELEAKERDCKSYRGAIAAHVTENRELRVELAAKDTHPKHVEAHLKAERILRGETSDLVIRELLIEVVNWRRAFDELYENQHPTEDK